MRTLLAGLVLLAVAAQAQSWNMATPYPPANFHTQNILQFVKEVEEATGGRLKITVHPGGSLFPHPQILPAVRNGQVQMGEVLMS
ncbi:MAG: C4-dicarboxylate ABC transporter substrate-binding protein, partial [Thermus caldifontis]